MSGIHHVTAIAGKPLRNFEFYTHTLGLRFVKKTVNFDDPGTYHFYYGDETGRPGTILTFFPWAGVPTGRRGVGETHQTAFRVPQGSLGYWTQRFVEQVIEQPIAVLERLKYVEGQIARRRRFGALHGASEPKRSPGANRSA